MKIADLLSGTIILEKINSKYNGDITVVKDFTWGTYIKVGGLTQSGGILTKVWDETLKKVLHIKPHVDKCLILGLGGGSVAKLVSSYWVGANIVGVDIDSKMVNMGKKYLGLEKIAIQTVINDAYSFVEEEKQKYDLILIDLYCGDEFPEKFERDEFIKKVKGILNKDGIAVFNRLYGSERRTESMRFGRRLEKTFRKVDYVYPQANLDLICYN